MDRGNNSVGKETFGPNTIYLSVSRPSCAAPAATHETRRRCSPSVSTCSATNVSRCVTTPGRGSAPSATVPSEPTTFIASTSPNSQRDGGVKREKSRRNQRRKKDRDETKELKIYSKGQTFCLLVLNSLWKDLFYRIITTWWFNLVTKQIVMHLTESVVL